MCAHRCDEKMWITPERKGGRGSIYPNPHTACVSWTFWSLWKKKEVGGGGRSPNDAGEPRGGTERLKCLLQLILGPVCRHFFSKSAHPEILANNGRRAQLPLLPVCEQLLTLKLKMNRLRACWFCWVFSPLLLLSPSLLHQLDAAWSRLVMMHWWGLSVFTPDLTFLLGDVNSSYWARSFFFFFLLLTHLATVK